MENNSTSPEFIVTNCSSDAINAKNSRRHRLRMSLFLWARILLTLSVLILLIATIKPQEILAAFGSAKYPFVAMSLALLLPNLAIKALKWGYLLRQVKPQISILEVVNTLLVGFTFGVVTPGQVGEFGRAFFISGRPRLEMIGLSFVEKLYNLLPIILGGSLGLLLLPGLVMDGNLYLFWSCCVLVLLLWAALVLIVLSTRWIRDLLYAANIMLPFREKTKILLRALDPVGRKQSLVLAGLGMSHYIISVVQYFFLVSSFQSVDFFAAIRAATATLFVKAALPISIGGLGVGETAAVAFFRIFEVSRAAAFNASVMLFSINVLLPAILGLLVLVRLRIVPDEADD
ncbi:MAG: lysylphosphatidylglycerol synthase transmembrane domain-containing protein [bacterium]